MSGRCGIALRVHQTREQSLHILVVARGARVHNFYIATHSLEEARNVCIHARCLVCVVLGSRVLDQLWDVVVEKRCEQNLVLVIETPVSTQEPRASMVKMSSVPWCPALPDTCFRLLEFQDTCLLGQQWHGTLAICWGSSGIAHWQSAGAAVAWHAGNLLGQQWHGTLAMGVYASVPFCPHVFAS